MELANFWWYENRITMIVTQNMTETTLLHYGPIVKFRDLKLLCEIEHKQVQIHDTIFFK